MVSRRNFFTITLIMIVLLFLFQVPEVAKDAWNRYNVNDYAYESGTQSSFGADSVQTQEETQAQSRKIFYVGDTADGAVGTVVKNWCAYTKRYLETYGSVQEIVPGAGTDARPQAVLIDSAYLDPEKDGGGDIDALYALTEKGVNLIFCNLPSPKEIRTNRRLMQLLGLRAILFDEVETEGIHLFDGLLLGGEKIYKLSDDMEETQQDLDLTMPWCQTASGTKVYMVGMLSSEEKNENLPAVIWRSSQGNAHVFAVNGDYLSDNAGLGFLEGMVYEMNGYSVYPVVNAQNLVVLDYPSMADENTDVMMHYYSMTLKTLSRDIIWPGLAATAQKSAKKMTCLITPQFDDKDDKEPESDLLVYYMKLLQEQNAETGLSAGNAPDVAAELAQDKKFLDQELPGYEFLSFYGDALSESDLQNALKQELLANVRTVFAGYPESGELFSYIDGHVTRQCAINDGYSHTFSEDIRMNSIQTVMAYSSISMDVRRVLFPENDEEVWEKLYEKFSSNTNTYWKAYDGFAATTLAESDMRIRRYLALGYTEKREGDTVSLDLENFEEEAWFLLRTHEEELKEAQGASFTQIGEDVYLIQAEEAQVRLTLAEEDRPYFR